MKIGNRNYLQYSNPVWCFQSDLPGIQIFVADFQSKASTTSSVLLQRKCWQLLVRRGIHPSEAPVELSFFRQHFKLNSCLTLGGNELQGSGFSARWLDCGWKLAGSSRSLRGSVGRNRFPYDPRLKSTALANISRSLPPSPPPRNKHKRREKVTDSNKSVKQNLVTQLSRFGILPSDFTTGQISSNLRNHSHDTPGDNVLNYASMPHKIDPQIFQVRR